MYRLFLLLIAGCFISGCGTGAQLSEFYEHDTLYKNYDHMKYSWCGYKNPTDDSYQKSGNEKWWGIPVEEKVEK